VPLPPCGGIGRGGGGIRSGFVAVMQWNPNFKDEV
jgi:hypothetical protein